MSVAGGSCYFRDQFGGRMVYLAGPIGKPFSQKDIRRFEQHEAWLRDMGAMDVFNPYRIMVPGADRREMAALLLQELLWHEPEGFIWEVLYCMDGWDKSRAAMVQMAVAQEVGIEIHTEHM